jgi:hypothetical protein
MKQANSNIGLTEPGSSESRARCNTRIAGLAMLFVAVTLSAGFARADTAPPPISLHPDNPHYFLFRGKPTVLIGSTEHYGAVLNLDIDQAKYLDTLKADGLNLTRTFSGYYRESPGTFGIRGNTLAPAERRYSSPWAATADGKWDLTKWNEEHFKRMRTFVGEAGKRGIVVELSIFCPFYEDQLWYIDPLNPKHNVNGVGREVKNRKELNTLKHKDVVAVQDALARKIVTELREFDNVYFEICNEPYFGGDLDWQRHIAAAIAGAEKDRPKPQRHLIAQNIANGSQKINDPDPAVSIFNFHYCNPPDAVGQNWGLDRVVGYDETGFKGSGDDVYRVHGWQFLMAGGAVYDHLDYSFTAGKEDGTAEISAPGGGGPTIRRQLHTLKQFMEGLDLVRMKPDRQAVKGSLPNGVRVDLLAAPGRQYAAYVARVTPQKQGKNETGRMDDPAAGQPVKLTLELPAGDYKLEWLDPKEGKPAGSSELKHAGGQATVESPGFTQDIALRITGGK